MAIAPRFFLPLLGLFFFATAAPGFSAGPSLTVAEKSAGWRLLYDGHSLAGWRLYGSTTKPAPIGPGWKAGDGILKKLAGTKGGARRRPRAQSCRRMETLAHRRPRKSRRAPAQRPQGAHLRTRQLGRPSGHRRE